MARKSYQTPFFYGDTGRRVFGAAPPVGLAWGVTAAEGDRVELEGPPLPGFGPSAELRVYGAASDAATARNPGKAKATVQIESGAALRGSSRIIGREAGARRRAAPVGAGEGAPR